MDVAKSQQPTEEDPEFVRQRRAAIDTLLTRQVSKTERFARQDVLRGTNLAMGFEQASQRAPAERPHTASSLTSITNRPTDMAAAAAAIKANTRRKTDYRESKQMSYERCWVSLSQYQSGPKTKLLMNPRTMEDADRSRIESHLLGTISTTMMMTIVHGEVAVLVVADGVEVADEAVVVMTEAKNYDQVKM